MRVFIFGVEADRELLERIEVALRGDGHVVSLSRRARFPVADSLSATLSFAASEHDCVITVLGSDAERDPWLAAEAATQAQIAGTARFVILGPSSSMPAPRLETFSRGDVEGLRHSLASRTPNQTS